MPFVIFESLVGSAVESDMPNGGRLVDICDERCAPVPFSCRSATCGTCRVDILDGQELLELPRKEELEVLKLFGGDPRRCRLACQARVKPGPGRLCVRPSAH